MRYDIKSFKIKILFIFLILFKPCFLGAQKVIDLIKVKNPFYTWASSIEMSYFQPVGYYEKYFNPAPFINFKMYFNPKIIDNLLINFEMGYVFSNAKDVNKTNYSILPMGLFLNYWLPLFKNDFHLGIHAGGGFYALKIDKENYTNFYTKFGANFRYNIAANLYTDAGFTYFHFYDKNEPLKGYTMALSFTYAFGTPLSEKDIQIIDFKGNHIFSAMYSRYYNTPVGALKIKNTTQKTIKDINISLYIKNYMDIKTYSKKKNIQLKKGEVAVIPVYSFFNESIKLLSIDTNTTGILEIEYKKSDGRSYKKRDLVQLKLFNKNALNWSNLNRLGSFVSFNDQTIIEFARQSLALKLDLGKHLPPDILNSIKIFESLKLYGINYVKDPKGGYNFISQHQANNDYIQYPRETLLRKTGDCDDLSVLLASLLESVGIKTSFVTTSDHIFILIQADNFHIEQGLVKYAGKKWIPIETTAINQGFFHAWQLGRAHFKGSIQKIKSAFEATSQYEPVLFHQKINLKFNLSKTKYVQNLKNELKQIKVWLEKKLSEKIANQSPEKLNTRGIELCQAGNLDKGEEFFLSAVKKNKKFLSSYYNLLILYRLKKEYSKAESIYDQLEKVSSNDSEGKMLITRIRNEQKANELISKQKNVSGPKASRYHLRVNWYR